MPTTYALIPGAGGEAWYWHRVSPLLIDRGAEVSVVALPFDDDSADLTRFADIVYDELAGVAGPVILVAQSMGAFIAPMVAQRRPAELIVLVNPMVPSPGEAVGQWWAATGQKAAMVDYFDRIGLGRNEFDMFEDFFHDVPDAVRQEALSRPEPAMSDTPFEQPWPLQRWPDVPTRVIAGSDDRLFPLEFQRRVTRETARVGRRRHGWRAPDRVEQARGVGRSARELPRRGRALGLESMGDLERILRETRSVAILGASANPLRASHEVWTYLKSASDYNLYLVNPTISEVDGTPVFPSLADLPEVPDLVDVFRRRDHLPSVLDETIKVGAKTLWLQLGLSDEQVERDGTAAGLQVVMDRCLKVDHARLLL